MNGFVKEILIASAANVALEPRSSVELEVGKGIVGDRYYSAKGTFSKLLAGKPDVEVTLIEQEEIDEFNNATGGLYSGSDFRRNIVTAGVRLNDLVEKTFTLGGIELRGVRLCEPCAHLANILGSEIMQHMIHKAGLRAQIVAGGELKLFDKFNI